MLAKIPESHTGQPGKPNESAKPVAVESATAKAPPPPPRFKLPSVDDDDDDDFDNAPTTTFIHRVKYTYDPDAPPEDIELLDDDVDEQEPPTAIPTSPYRGEGTDSSDEPDVSSSTKDEPVPTSKQPAHPVSAPSRTASKPIRSPIAQSPQHAGAPLADPRLYETQQLRGTRFNARQGKQTNVGMVDPDAAPVWLKAIALSSVVSAITVLGVLGWMISKKF
ncbi:MAG: hypothetical protein CSA75_04315 [Sorangium cellulosum]|nr:MAG: hypothetical protein CSA75_04315 [Sorangium cellulosum]